MSERSVQVDVPPASAKLELDGHQPTVHGLHNGEIENIRFYTSRAAAKSAPGVQTRLSLPGPLTS